MISKYYVDLSYVVDYHEGVYDDGWQGIIECEPHNLEDRIRQRFYEKINERCDNGKYGFDYKDQLVINKVFHLRGVEDPTKYKSAIARAIGMYEKKRADAKAAEDARKREEEETKRKEIELLQSLLAKYPEVVVK